MNDRLAPRRGRQEQIGDPDLPPAAPPAPATAPGPRGAFRLRLDRSAAGLGRPSARRRLVAPARIGHAWLATPIRGCLPVPTPPLRGSPLPAATAALAAAAGTLPPTAALTALATTFTSLTAAFTASAALTIALRLRPVRQLLDQLGTGQHSVARYVRVGRERMQLGKGLGLQLGFSHRHARLFQPAAASRLRVGSLNLGNASGFDEEPHRREG